MDELPYGVLAALVGLAGGIVLGLSARLGDFCTLGALESAVYGKDSRRLRLWGVVLGVAILTTQALALTGWIELENSFYHTIHWNPLARSSAGWCSDMAWPWPAIAASAHWCVSAAATCARWWWWW